MPIPLAALLAGLSAGTSIGTGFMQTGAQKQINRENINFAERQLLQQREWALSDWDKVNAYNSPLQQMNRYKEAGLNPQLIYGNAQNSPAAMVRSANAEAPKADARGIVEGIGTIAGAPAAALNSYMAIQDLTNKTNESRARVLNLKAQADKTTLDAEVTRRSFDDLIMRPWFQNAESGSRMTMMDAQRNILPERAMAFERYLAETAKTDAQAKHAQELYNLAKQEGKLKQADIDMLESLSAAPMGVKLIVDILKMILGLKKPF